MYFADACLYTLNTIINTNIASGLPSNNKGSLFGISLAAALAGFIFGFDTVAISGANLPLKELWHISLLFHGLFIMSMALTIPSTIYSLMVWGISESPRWLISKKADFSKAKKYCCV